MNKEKKSSNQESDHNTIKAKFVKNMHKRLPYVELDTDEESDHNSRGWAVPWEGVGTDDFGVLWWQQAAAKMQNQLAGPNMYK